MDINDLTYAKAGAIFPPPPRPPPSRERVGEGVMVLDLPEGPDHKYPAKSAGY